MLVSNLAPWLVGLRHLPKEKKNDFYCKTAFFMHAQYRAVIHSLLQTIADVPYLNFVTYLRIP